MFATRNKAKIGAVVSTAALCLALLAPTAAYAAEGDEATVTSDTTVVEEATPSTEEAAPEASTPAEEPAEEAPAEEVAPEKEPPVVADEPVQEETKAPAEESDKKDSKDDSKAKDDTKSTKTNGDHEKACTDDKDVTVDDRNERLTEATVTLKPDFTTCDVSLEGFETHGPTWPTSGPQEDVDFDTVTLTKQHPTATLKIVNKGCFQQNDLFIGKTRFDGIDGPLPHYPDSNTPTNIIASWNGGEACAPPTYGSCPTPTKTINVYEDTAAEQGIGVTFTREGGTLTWDGDSWVLSTPGSNDKITFGLTSTDYQIPLNELTALSAEATLVQPGSHPAQIVAGNVPVDVNGDAPGGFTTIVIEAVYNNGSLDFFQSGEAIVWSSNAIPGYPNRDTFKSWKFLLEQNPDAVLLGQALLNQGGGNAGLISKVTSFTVGNSEKCVTYVPKEEKPPVVIGSNPAYTVDQTCGWIEITATNEVTLKDGEIGTDAFFELNVGNGETQLITVKPNEKVVKTLSFEEDSGVQIVKFGVKGEDQETFTVETDCAQTPYNPFNAEFHEACGSAEDGTIVPGIKQNGMSAVLPNGDTYYSYQSVTDDGTYYVSENTIDGVKSSRVVFVSSDPDVDIAPPGEGDSYTVVDNTAVWTYTFNNEPCPPNNPPKPPVPPVVHHPVTHPNGGIDTGASGAFQGVASDVSVAGVTASSSNNINDGVLWALVVLMLGGAAAVRPIRKAVAARK